MNDKLKFLMGISIGAGLTGGIIYSKVHMVKEIMEEESN